MSDHSVPGAFAAGPMDGETFAALAAAGVGLTASVAVGFCYSVGQVAAFATGHPTAPASLGTLSRFTAGGFPAVWPGTPVAAFIATGTTAALAAGAATSLGLAWAGPRISSARVRHALDARLRHLGGDADAGHLPRPRAAAEARRLRPDLAGTPVRRLSRSDVGPYLGRGFRSLTPYHSTWEYSIVAIMGTRAGKTTQLVIPNVVDAPGPVVATSNKPDVVHATAGIRRELTGGRIWIFDTNGIASASRTSGGAAGPGGRGMYWNPLAGVTSYDDAYRLAGHLVMGLKSGGQRDFWDSSAHSLLAALVLAAATAGRDLRAVMDWASNERDDRPGDILTDAGHTAPADALASLRTNRAAEMIGSIYGTAREALAPLQNRDTLAWLTPHSGLDGFDPDAFVTSRDTLYPLSMGGDGSAAPLVAALVDAVIRAATRAANSTGTGRLAVPLLLALDEVANIVRIRDLPALYSHVGSRGIVPLTILQSWAQGENVWGRQGMAAMWSAANVGIIGANITDTDHATRVALACGNRKVRRTTVTTGGRASGGRSSTLVDEPRMGAEHVMALPADRALLFTNGGRVTGLRLEPWYTHHPLRDRMTALAQRIQP